MKTKILLIIGLLITTIYSLKAQTFNSTYINYGGVLDLKTTSILFGEASSLMEFEQYLNDPDIQASNLDLNNDGYVDYLKVTGAYQNSRYIIQINSIIAMNQYTEIASIVVRNINYRYPSILIEGNPLIYGNNYILTPNYSRRPNILWSFSSLAFNRWNSPYYWGYYPRNYRYHRIIGTGDYYKHLNIRFGFSYPQKYYDNRNWSNRPYNNRYHNQNNNSYNHNYYKNSNKRQVPSYNHKSYNHNYYKNSNKKQVPSYSPQPYNNNKTAPSNIRYRSPSSTITTSKRSYPKNNSSQNTIKRSVSSHPKATGTKIIQRTKVTTSKSTKSTSTSKNTKTSESNKTTSPVRR